MQYITNSEKETKKLAKSLAKDFEGRVIALSGELGAGKTTFVQGFAKGLGIKEKIISPTFVLIRQHKIPKSSKTLYHIDLYRLKGAEDLKELGLEEILSNPNAIILIEWPEKMEQLLAKNTVKITITTKSNHERIIRI